LVRNPIEQSASGNVIRTHVDCRIADYRSTPRPVTAIVVQDSEDRIPLGVDITASAHGEAGITANRTAAAPGVISVLYL
jgi:hypothetical protein